MGRESADGLAEAPLGVGAGGAAELAGLALAVGDVAACAELSTFEPSSRARELHEHTSATTTTAAGRNMH
jgi:hypothetical protein